MDATLGRRPRGATPRTLGRLAATAIAAGALLVPAATTLAVAPVPATDAARSTVVDGDRSEWDRGGDRFADMYRAAKATKPVESRLFLRYDCDAGVLFAMVETVDGVSLQPGGDQFLKIDGRKQAGSPAIGDFVLSPDGRGWEAGLAIGPGAYDLDVHAQVLDGGSQTSAVTGRSIPLLVECPAGAGPDATPSPTAAPTPSPAATPTAEATGGPTPAAESTPTPVADPSFAAGTGAPSTPSPSTLLEPSPAAGSTAAPRPDPIDGAPEQGTDPGPAPTDSVEPDLSGDPDPHDEIHGPRGICGCEPAPGESPYESAVLGIVSGPSVTPPPTDALANDEPTSTTGRDLSLVLLGLALSGLGALAVARRRPAAERI